MYIGRPLDGSEELVLSEALGAKLKSPRLVCAAFNHRSSPTLDETLFAVRGDRSPSRCAREEGKQKDPVSGSAGKTIEIDALQRPKMLQPVRPEIRDLGGKRHVSMRGTDFVQMSKVLKTVVGGDRVAAALAGEVFIERGGVGSG